MVFLLLFYSRIQFIFCQIDKDIKYKIFYHKIQEQ